MSAFRALRPPEPRLALAAALLAAIACGLPAVPVQAQTVGQVFKRVNASAVVIRTKEHEATGEPGVRSVPGVGSGVLISRDGKVMTAAHLVQTADEIVVEFLTGATVGARVVASEPEADVALLQLEPIPSGAVVATLGDSDRVAVGDPVFIIGAPYGIGHTLTVGHISARHKPSTVYSELSLAEFLQTDAAINQGNSGGPMFSMRGEVIGIVSHIISRSGGFEGLGFVVTINMARRLLLEERSFWTGLQGIVLSGPLARAFNLPQTVGLLIQRVAERSPAAETGLRGGTLKATIDGRTFLVGGDVILEVYDVRLDAPASYDRIREKQRALQAGQEVSVVVLRDGQRVELRWRVPARP